MLFSLRQNETVTYWGAPAPSSLGGRSFAAPIELAAHWADKQEQFQTEAGEQIVSRSVIWLPQDVEVGGYLFRGVSAASDPTQVAGAGEIQAFVKTPDIRNLEFERRAIL